MPNLGRLSGEGARSSVKLLALTSSQRGGPNGRWLWASRCRSVRCRFPNGPSWGRALPFRALGTASGRQAQVQRGAARWRPAANGAWPQR